MDVPGAGCGDSGDSECSKCTPPPTHTHVSARAGVVSVQRRPFHHEAAGCPCAGGVERAPACTTHVGTNDFTPGSSNTRTSTTILERLSTPIRLGGPHFKRHLLRDHTAVRPARNTLGTTTVTTPHHPARSAPTHALWCVACPHPLTPPRLSMSDGRVPGPLSTTLLRLCEVGRLSQATPGMGSHPTTPQPPLGEVRVGLCSAKACLGSSMSGKQQVWEPTGRGAAPALFR